MVSHGGGRLGRTTAGDSVQARISAHGRGFASLDGTEFCQSTAGKRLMVAS